MEIIKALVKILLLPVGAVIFVCVLPFTFPIAIYNCIREMFH